MVLPEFVVTHPDRQHPNHLARALDEEGWLRAYLSGVPAGQNTDYGIAQWLWRRLIRYPVVPLSRVRTFCNPVAPLMLESREDSARRAHGKESGVSSLTMMTKAYLLRLAARTKAMRHWAIAALCYQLRFVWQITLYDSVAAIFYFSAIGLAYWPRAESGEVMHGVVEHTGSALARGPFARRS